MPISPALPDATTSDGIHQPDVAALEREVRADPVIQELMRIGGTELAEVRPLDESESS